AAGRIRTDPLGRVIKSSVEQSLKQQGFSLTKQARQLLDAAVAQGATVQQIEQLTVQMKNSGGLRQYIARAPRYQRAGATFSTPVQLFPDQSGYYQPGRQPAQNPIPPGGDFRLVQPGDFIRAAPADSELVMPPAGLGDGTFRSAPAPGT